MPRGASLDSPHQKPLRWLSMAPASSAARPGPPVGSGSEFAYPSLKLLQLATVLKVLSMLAIIFRSPVDALAFAPVCILGCAKIVAYAVPLAAHKVGEFRSVSPRHRIQLYYFLFS